MKEEVLSKDIKEKAAIIEDLEKSMAEKEWEVAFKLQECNKIIR